MAKIKWVSQAKIAERLEQRQGEAKKIDQAREILLALKDRKIESIEGAAEAIDAIIKVLLSKEAP